MAYRQKTTTRMDDGGEMANGEWRHFYVSNPTNSYQYHDYVSVHLLSISNIVFDALPFRNGSPPPRSSLPSFHPLLNTMYDGSVL
eukprot:scaffold12224_cov40-Cyclotella_meneghiniana.AAC.6